MNKKQIDLLIKNNYEVLPEVDLIIENGFNSSKVSIVYNSLIKKFCLNVCGTTLKPDEIKSFQDEVNLKSNLVNQLNELA